MNIDNVVCLCLDKRQKEWEDLAQQCKNVGLPFTPYIVGDGTLDLDYSYIDDPNPNVDNWRYAAVGHKINHYNAHMSHKGMARQALENGSEWTLFLEDDAYITDRFKSVWNDDLMHQAIDEMDIDLLYLGWWVGDENDTWNKIIEYNWEKNKTTKLFKAGIVGGFHGVVLSKRALELILQFPVDDPIDSYFNQLHNNLNSYVLTPKIIHTKSIYSFCEGAIINRNII